MEKLSPLPEPTESEAQKGKRGAERSKKGAKLSDLMMERLEMAGRSALGEDFIRDRVGQDAGNHSICVVEQWRVSHGVFAQAFMT